MTDDFISSFRSDRDFDDEPEEDLPEWVGGLGPDDVDDLDDFGERQVDFSDREDDFDQLRRKSARTGAAYDEMALEDDDNGNISLSHLTPPQRLVLAVLLLLNVIVITVGVLLLLNVI
jgi:hypothetical protein